MNEMTRSHPRPAWTHRPYPRRRKRSVGRRIAALLRPAPAPSAAPAPA